MESRVGVFSFLGLFILLAVIPSARAEDRPEQTARAHYQEGMKRYNLAHYPEALQEFEAGYLIKPDPAFIFNIGQCHRLMGNYPEEIRAYRNYLRERPNAPNRQDVEDFIANAENELQRLPARTPATEAVLPKPAPSPSTVSSGLALSGQGGSPSLPASTPIYKKWWLWTAVGAVVIGASVGIGFAASSAADAPILSTNAGTFNATFH